jgi:frataxin-like iron-binding protein CyaY
MSKKLYISATVEGDQFFYEQSHEWKYINDTRMVEWFNHALTDLSQVAQNEEVRGDRRHQRETWQVNLKGK